MKRGMCLSLGLAMLAVLTIPIATLADDAAANPRVKISTTLGDFVVELDAEKAPITVKNFLGYVNDGFYEGMIFHRVMPNFMIQGGGFDENMVEKTEGVKAPIKLESDNGIKNVKYTIAMARKPNPDSATVQFFINVTDNTRILDHRPGYPGYAAFGKVVEGQDIVEKIRTTQCILHEKYKTRDGAVTPKTPVVIKKAAVVKTEATKDGTDAKSKDGE